MQILVLSLFQENDSVTTVKIHNVQRNFETTKAQHCRNVWQNTTFTANQQQEHRRRLPR